MTQRSDERGATEEAVQPTRYPAGEIMGKATVRYRFWAGGAEEVIEQTFEGTMRQVKNYVAGFTKAIKDMPDWGGPG